MSLRRLLPLLGNRSVDLVRAGYLHPAFTVSRASAKTAVLGGSLIEYGNNLPAFDDRGLGIHEQRTNVVTNPRAGGAVAGTPGTVPTGWGARPSGCTTEIVGATTINGIPGLVFHIAGTPTTTAAQSWALSATNTCTVGNTICTGGYFAILAGDMTNITSVALRGNGASDNGINISNTWVGTPKLFERRWTSTVGTGIQPVLRWSYGDTVTPVDITFFIGGIHQEINVPSLGPLILPPAGTPAASTRLRDDISASLASLGFTAREIVIFGRCNMSQIPATGISQTVFQIDSGFSTDRYSLRTNNASAAFNITRSAGGVEANSGTTAQSMTPGADFGWAARINTLTGVATAWINGGAAVSVSGGPTFAMTNFRLGTNQSAAASTNGFFPWVRGRNYGPTDAECQALSNLAA